MITILPLFMPREAIYRILGISLLVTLDEYKVCKFRLSHGSSLSTYVLAEASSLHSPCWTLVRLANQ